MPGKYGVKVLFKDGADIVVTFDTEDEAETYINTMRAHEPSGFETDYAPTREAQSGD